MGRYSGSSLFEGAKDLPQNKGTKRFTKEKDTSEEERNYRGVAKL